METSDYIIDKLLEEWVNDDEGDLREYFCRLWNLAMNWRDDLENEI